MTRKEGKFQDILKITCGLSLICFGIVIFTNNFLWFSFTEGWYNSWIDLGSLSSIYDSGFPFPPIYIIFYKFFLNIFDIFSIDRYFGLRLIGILISFLNLFILFRTLRNLGNNSSFSLLISSVSLIIFHSMEALISYDYTPFIGLLVSLLAFFITDRDGFLYFRNVNIISIVRPIGAIVSTIFLIGAKQSTVPIIFVFVIIYLFSRKSKLEIFSFIFSGIILFSLYIFLTGQNIGFDNFINIYTNAEYKGGVEKIITRAPRIFADSASKFNKIIVFTFFKESIIFSILLAISAFLFKKSFALSKNNKFYFLKLFGISFFILTLVSLFPRTQFISIIRNFRESGVSLIFISFISLGLMPKLDNQKKFLHVLLVIFGLSITITNVMSGGTGAFDSFLIICVLSSSINNIINYSRKNPLETSRFLNIPIIIKRFPNLKTIIFYIVNYSLGCIKLLFLGLLSGISTSTMSEILNKGYQWWGISEKTNYSIINDKLSYVKGEEALREIPGSPFMSEAQRNFTYRSKKLVEKYRAKNILSFPNIPYFYEAFNVEPFAQSPLSWIDVTGIKASKKQIKEWDNEKPEVIIFNFMNSNVYNIQGEAFLEKDIINHSFLYLNNKIIQAVKDGDYIIVDSYLSNNSGYGLFTIIRSDIDSEFYNKDYSKKQKEVIKFLESYYDNGIEKLVAKTGQISYLPMICFEHKKDKMKDFRRKLLVDNGFDCNENGMGRVEIPENINNLKNSGWISLFKNNNQINDIEEEKILEILKKIKYSNHISVFSYLLSSYGY